MVKLHSVSASISSALSSLGQSAQALVQKEPPPKPDPTYKPEHTIQPDLFEPSPLRQGANRFVVIGDAGSGKKAQMEIAEQMQKFFEKRPFQSVLVLGDNVYEHGEPRYFEERIRKPYEGLFEAGVKFYPILGNHDVKWGFGDQQLNYWGAPRFYSFKLGPKHNEVEIFAVDTTIMLPGAYESHQQNPFLAKKQAEIQSAWLDKALSESTAKMKVVMGHYPVYSSGAHGVLEKSLLKFRNQMEPVLVKHGVDLYLAGHEHHYEKSKPIQGVHYIISGAAGKVFKVAIPVPIYPRDQIIKKYHFMVFDITPQGLSYQVISKKGNVLDAGLIPKAVRPRSQAHQPAAPLGQAFLQNTTRP